MNGKLRMVCDREVSHLNIFFFQFYLKEVTSDISKQPVVCTLICSKFNIIGYADDLVLVAPIAQALKILLNVPTSKLYTLSLQVNVQKSWNVVVNCNKKGSTSLIINNQPMRQVMETTDLVVFIDDLSCATDFELAKLDSFEHVYSIYRNFGFVDKNILINLFQLHEILFYCVETWYI